MDYKMIVNTINAIAENFGDNAFTDKDWENVKAKICETHDWEHLVPAISTLRKHKLLKVVKTEKFPVQKNIYYAYNDNGEKIMKWRKYIDSPTTTKKNIEASTNEGKPLHYKNALNIETVTMKCYYYKFNPKGIDIIYKTLSGQAEAYKALEKQIQFITE